MLDDSKLTVSDVMTRDVVTVFSDTSLRYAAKLMAQHRISGLMVVGDTGHLLGILTEEDLLQLRDEEPEHQAWWLNMLADGFELSPGFLEVVRSERDKVSNLMTREVISVTEGVPLQAAAKLMTEHGIKRLPVLRGTRLVGVISRGDLIRAMAES